MTTSGPDRLLNESPQRPTTETDDAPIRSHHYINCEICGKRMLVEVAEGSHRHRCPICGRGFETIFENQRLTVIFDDHLETKTQPPGAC